MTSGFELKETDGGMERTATEDMGAEIRGYVLSVLRDMEKLVQSGWVGHHSVRSFITIVFLRATLSYIPWSLQPNHVLSFT